MHLIFFSKDGEMCGVIKKNARSAWMVMEAGRGKDGKGAMGTTGPQLEVRVRSTPRLVYI